MTNGLCVAINSQDKSKGFTLNYPDNIDYIENQWVEDTLVAFERQLGDEGEHVQNLGSILCHFAHWCGCNGLQLSEALKIAATRHSEETVGKGRQSGA